MSYKVLIVESNKVDAALMQEHLDRAEASFGEISQVHEKKEFEHALHSFHYDLIVSNYKNGGLTGSQVLEICRASGLHIPVVVVSDTIGEEKAVELIKAGAADFLIKENIPRRLAHVAVRAIEESREKKKLKEIEEQLQWHHKVQILQKEIGVELNQNRTFNDSLRTVIDKILAFLGCELGHLFIRDGRKYRSSDVWVQKGKAGLEEFIAYTAQNYQHTNKGLVGRAAREKELLWVDADDMQPDFARHEVLRKTGIKHGVLVPVVVGDTTEAILEFYTVSSKKIERHSLAGILNNIALQVGRLLERRQNIERLRKEKERFELLAENATDMISRHDEAGKYLYVSPSCKKLMGFEPEELLGTSSYNYFHPDDIPHIKATHQAMLESEVEKVTQYRIRTKNEGWCWVESISKTVRDPQSGEVIDIQSATRDISERMKYEQELEEQLNLNERIINSLPGIFFIIRKDGQIVRTNHAFREVFDLDENGHNHFTKFIAESDREEASDVFRQTFTEGKIEMQINLLNKQGEVIPFLISGIVDMLTGTEHIIGTGINIKERQLIEQELVKEKKFTDRAINSLPGLFYVLDENQNYIRINQSFIELLGYSREEISEMNPMDFYLDEDKSRIQEVIAEAFEKGSASVTSHIKTKSGKLPWFLLTGSHFEEEGKNYILGTGIDITEQKKLEELLNQAQQMAQIGAWELDVINGELSWTNVTKQIHEVPADFSPTLDEALDFYKDGESKKTMVEAIKQAREEGKPYDIELQIETAKGNVRWVRSIGKPEFRKGECIRIYGSFQDIHEKKKAEEQIRRSLKEKEVLLMEIHHRVKNNLALVSGFMQLQAFQTNDEKVFKYLNDNQSRIKSIALIHEQLYQNSSLSKISLKKNTEKLLTHLKNSFGVQKDIATHLQLQDIEVNINQAIPFALILNELFTNVIKHAFTGHQEGDVWVHLEFDPESDQVTLKLADNGIGLPDNFSLENPDTLGVTLLNNLASQLHGELEYSSSGGEGTEFTLCFTKKETAKGPAGNVVG